MINLLDYGGHGRNMITIVKEKLKKQKNRTGNANEMGPQKALEGFNSKSSHCQPLDSVTSSSPEHILTLEVGITFQYILVTH